MYINFVKDRKALGFMSLRDSEAGTQVAMIFETPVIWIAIMIFVNSRLFINEQDLSHRSYSGRRAHKRVISSISNEFQSLEDFLNSGKYGVEVVIPSGNGSDEKVILIKKMEYYLG